MITRREALTAGAAATAALGRFDDAKPDDPFDGYPLMWSTGLDEHRGQILTLGPGDLWVVTAQKFWPNEKEFVWVVQPLDPNSRLKRELEQDAFARGSRVMQPSKLADCS